MTRKRGLQFVHIPKTAGSSIENTYLYKCWGCWSQGKSRNCSFWHEHNPVHIPIDNSDTFCVIRNPYDRLLSEYKYKNHPDDPEKMNELFALWYQQYNNNPYIYDNHLRPQYLFAEQCTHVLLFDNLENELAELLPKYGIKPLKLMWSQKSNNYDNICVDLISDDNKKWINHLYKKDFDIFNDLILSYNLKK